MHRLLLRALWLSSLLASLHGAAAAQDRTEARPARADTRVDPRVDPRSDNRVEAAADPGAAARAPAWRALLPDAQPAGAGRLRFWGFEVYDARLWVAPDFRQSQFERHGFALELAYLRDFSPADIAERSLAEMRRAGSFDAAQAQRWQTALAALLPPVQRGDRLTGVYRPGRGATFLMNGTPLGEIADAEFARLFFAIWLGERSSEPALRRLLLAGTPP